MKTPFSRVLALALVAVIPAVVRGHGIPLKITVSPTNQLVSSSLVNYEEEDSELVLSASGIKGAAGFYPEFGVFPAGQALSVDVSGSPQHPAAVIYWDGAGLAPVPVNVALTRTGISLSVAPADTFLTGGTLPPYNGAPDGHSALTITLPTDAPAGLYAIGFQVSSPNYGRSETFWGVANYGLTDPDDVARGLAAIHSQVPEPTALVLLVTGSASCGVLVRCRRSRRRLAA